MTHYHMIIHMGLSSDVQSHEPNISKTFMHVFWKNDK